jgi:nucleoside-diphosphate-sugar epimerase
VINEVTGTRVPLRALPAWTFRLAGHAGSALARLTGRPPEATPEGVAIACACARVVSRRAEQELGYRPAALRTMIEDSYRWLRTERLLESFLS